MANHIAQDLEEIFEFSERKMEQTAYRTAEGVVDKSVQKGANLRRRTLLEEVEA